MTEGLSHITFIVRDLERMAQFLTLIFEAREVYSSGDAGFSISREKFFLVPGVWIAVMAEDPLPERTYNHVAFKIREEDFEMFADRVRSLGVEVREGRSRVEGEGRSLYVYDYDNHLFELPTATLDQRLARYRLGLKVSPKSPPRP
jgi:fosfomycin resistance protein FosX